MLKDEDSRLFQGDFGGIWIQNGLVLNNLHGFQVYIIQQPTIVGTGPAHTGG